MAMAAPVRLSRPIPLLGVAALALTGCLITDPIQPIEDEQNTNPVFFQIAPSNDAPVIMQIGSTTPKTFTARATDNESGLDLQYEWTIDDGAPVQGPGPQYNYTTNAVNLGAGVHFIQVLVTDEGLPTGFNSLEWEIHVE